MHWLENWTVSERLPAGCRPAVEAAVAMLEASLAPAGAKERAVALGILFDWVAAYEVARIPDDPEERRVWVAQKMAAYSQDLADLPADLLMQAVDVVRRTRRYSSLPLPGDLRAAVAEPPGGSARGAEQGAAGAAAEPVRGAAGAAGLGGRRGAAAR